MKINTRTRVATFMTTLLVAPLAFAATSYTPTPEAEAADKHSGCQDRKIPRVEFLHDKPISKHDLLMQADLFYARCWAARMSIKPQMFVMSFNTLGSSSMSCADQGWEYIAWVLVVEDPFGNKAIRGYRTDCNRTTEGTKSVFFGTSIPRFYFANSGTWPALAPKWTIKAEIVRPGPTPNSHYEKRGAFPLQ